MHGDADVVLGVFEAIEERDREKLLELCHEDVEFHEAASLPYGGSIRGKETLRAQLETAPQSTWLGTWRALQPTEQERRMDPRVVTTGGDEVVVTYRQRAVGPAGERFDAPVLAIYEVRDGKVARAQMFHFDTAAVVDFFERVATATPERAE